MPEKTDNKVRKRVKREENLDHLPGPGAGDQRTDEESSPAVAAESVAGGEKCASFVVAPSSFIVTVNVNVLIALLTLVSFLTRFWRLEEPRGVV